MPRTTNGFLGIKGLDDGLYIAFTSGRASKLIDGEFNSAIQAARYRQRFMSQDKKARSIVPQEQDLKTSRQYRVYDENLEMWISICDESNKGNEACEGGEGNNAKHSKKVNEASEPDDIFVMLFGSLVMLNETF